MMGPEQAEGEAAADQSLVLANKIAQVCYGEKTVPVFAALSMMVGHMAAQAASPDFNATMRLIEEGAFASFLLERESITAEGKAR